MTLNIASGKDKVKIIWKVFRKAGNSFIEDKVAKLAGSLAYTIIFSLGPLIMVIISLSSIFFGKAAIEGQLYLQFAGFVGSEAAAQIQEVVKNASLEGKGTVSFIIGLVVLLIGSTALFSEIQTSINTIWKLKARPTAGWLKLLKDRVLSFSIVISLGFLLIVSLGLSTLIDGFSNYLIKIFPEVTVVVFYVINLIINIATIGFIFAIIFKVLPDATVRWRHVKAGAIATAILFMIGKVIISYYISTTNVGSAFGAASSVVVLLTWVYYSALILYFGAEFTKFYALHYGDRIIPNSYAVGTKTIEIETEEIDDAGEKVVVKESVDPEKTAEIIVQKIEEQKECE